MSEAEKILEPHRGPPRGLASHVVMGTVSHKESPEVTVSESKERKTTLACRPGIDPRLRLSCNGKMFAKERGTYVCPLKNWGGEYQLGVKTVLSTYAEPGMNDSLQQRGGDVPRIAERGITNLETFSAHTPVFLSPTVSCRLTFNTFPDVCPVPQASAHLWRVSPNPFITFSSFLPSLLSSTPNSIFASFFFNPHPRTYSLILER